MRLFGVLLSALSALLLMEPLLAAPAPAAAAGSWRLINNGSQWSPRSTMMSWTDGVSVFLANGVLNAASNGYAPATQAASDAWRSDDGGLTWTDLSAGYRSLWVDGAGASFGGWQFVLGGRHADCSNTGDSSVWSRSNDPAASWSAGVGPFGLRYGHTLAVVTPPPATGLASMLLLVAGSTCGYGWWNDVWSYSRGNSWTQLTAAAPFPNREGAGMSSIHSASRVVLAGGTNGKGAMNDVWQAVWSAGPQLSWIQLTAAASWSGRNIDLVSSSDDHLYLSGAAGEGGGVDYADLWSSADGGVSWSSVPVAASFSPRSGAALVALGRELLLFGGFSVDSKTGTTTSYNDVYSLYVH